MKLCCYTDELGGNIVIELSGNTVNYEKRKMLLDSWCVDSFARTDWVKDVIFPSHRKILIVLRTTPTKKQWKSASERWLAELDKNMIGVDLIDKGVIMGVKIPEKQNITSEDKPPGTIPGAVHIALQKACYEKIDKILGLKTAVKKLKQEYEAAEDNLRARQDELRIIVNFLDEDNQLGDGDSSPDWENRAIEKGALEDRISSPSV
jgi:hypothetical protein